MQTVNIHEAKTHLSSLIEKAIRGEPFIIAKAGKPLVQVTRLLDDQENKKNRFDFMAGQIQIPDDFNTMGQGEIENMFYSIDDEEIIK